jgi:SAM-dependent methyltransferase
MTDGRPVDPPSPFVAAWVPRLAAEAPLPRRALDVAMGKGRHTVLLAGAGFSVFGVDRDLDALRAARERLLTHGQHVFAWCADLTRSPLPEGRFDLILVTRYLQRDLFAALVDGLTPDGILLYETFTEGQCAYGRGPTSPDHLLKPGELRRCTSGLEVLHYTEVDEPDCVAQLVARRRS